MIQSFDLFSALFSDILGNELYVAQISHGMIGFSIIRKKGKLTEVTTCYQSL